MSMPRSLPRAPAGVVRSLVLAVALLACLAVFASPGADAAELPALTGRVVDDAGIIDADAERALTEKLAAFEEKSSDQIVVATVKDLGGEAIEPYANRLFRAWQLGQAGEDNGVLLLVAVNDRKMRIEVGYGLEGTLTDLHSKLIIADTMVPAFRKGDFSGGISRAVDDIIMVLEGNAAELEARAERNQQQEDGSSWPNVLFFLLWFSFFFGGVGFSFLAPIFGRRIGPGRYRWLGMTTGRGRRRRSAGWYAGPWVGGGGFSGGGGFGGGGFSGGGGSSGGGGASGGW
jgi:uncharacterized protein